MPTIVRARTRTGRPGVPMAPGVQAPGVVAVRVAGSVRVVARGDEGRLETSWRASVSGAE
jgi:hypothetical protein